jgi:hypothetical protein
MTAGIEFPGPISRPSCSTCRMDRLPERGGWRRQSSTTSFDHPGRKELMASETGGGEFRCKLPQFVRNGSSSPVQ